MSDGLDPHEPTLGYDDEAERTVRKWLNAAGGDPADRRDVLISSLGDIPSDAGHPFCLAIEQVAIGNTTASREEGASVVSVLLPLAIAEIDRDLARLRRVRVALMLAKEAE